jgi:ABC-type Fe3+-hydroxamate transport system substrate-binding protein
MILQNPYCLDRIPKRIVSLVPSQTELLYSLKLDKETVGITKFCVHPDKWFSSKTKVGGTKNVNMDNVHHLQPDLIIANKEENEKVQIELLSLDYPVWLTDINNLKEALQMITDIGALTGKGDAALQLCKLIKQNFDDLKKPVKPIRTAYLIWRKPYMTIGGDTFINDMLQNCGFENIYANKSRYPEISFEDLQTAGCQLLMLSSEPYPFKQKHIFELCNQLPKTKIILVDGEFFSWYGSRLLKAPEYFKKLIESTVELN